MGRTKRWSVLIAATIPWLALNGCTPIIEDATPRFQEPSPDGKYDVRVLTEPAPITGEAIDAVSVEIDDRSAGTSETGALIETALGVWEIRFRISDCERRAYYAFSAETPRARFRHPKEGFFRLNVKRRETLDVFSPGKPAFSPSLVFVKDPSEPDREQRVPVTARNSYLNNITVVNVYVSPEDPLDPTRMVDHQAFDVALAAKLSLPLVLACGDTIPVTVSFSGRAVRREVRARLVFDLADPWPDRFISLVGIAGG